MLVLSFVQFDFNYAPGGDLVLLQLEMEIIKCFADVDSNPDCVDLPHPFGAGHAFCLGRFPAAVMIAHQHPASFGWWGGAGLEGD